MEDKLQDLQYQLYQEFMRYHEKWCDMPPVELIEASREITAIRDAFEYLTEAHDFEPEEVDFLLQSENPLKLVADKWCERIGDMSDFCFALDEAFKGMPSKDAPQVEQPSALEKLREKAAEVKAHLPAPARAVDREAR